MTWGQAAKAVVLQLDLGTAGAGDALHLAVCAAFYFGGFALGAGWIHSAGLCIAAVLADPPRAGR